MCLCRIDHFLRLAWTEFVLSVRQPMSHCPKHAKNPTKVNVSILTLKQLWVIASYAQFLLIKAFETHERSRGQQTGRELSQVQPDVVYFIVSQQCHVIHYTLLRSWTDECLQTVATPRDKANCCCAAIVFKAPFCGCRANWCSSKEHMDAHWQCPSCGGRKFCFWLWNMILFFPSSRLVFFSLPLFVPGLF